MKIVTPQDLGDQINKPTKTLAQWRWLGKGPRFIKLENGEVRYDQADIDAWLERQKVGGAAATARGRSIGKGELFLKAGRTRTQDTPSSYQRDHDNRSQCHLCGVAIDSPWLTCDLCRPPAPDGGA